MLQPLMQQAESVSFFRVTLLWYNFLLFKWSCGDSDITTWQQHTNKLLLSTETHGLDNNTNYSRLNKTGVLLKKHPVEKCFIKKKRLFTCCVCFQRHWARLHLQFLHLVLKIAPVWPETPEGELRPRLKLKLIKTTQKTKLKTNWNWNKTHVIFVSVKLLQCWIVGKHRKLRKMRQGKKTEHGGQRNWDKKDPHSGQQWKHLCFCPGLCDPHQSSGTEAAEMLKLFVCREETVL